MPQESILILEDLGARFYLCGPSMVGYGSASRTSYHHRQHPAPREHRRRRRANDRGQVKERVPDWVVRKADQIELVDSSPEALRRRMLHGNIYPQAKVPQALTHFFRTDNLIALRELALRFLADETDEELLEHLQRRHTQVLWETSERILVAVTAAPGTDAIVRRAARMAARIKAHLHVLHVVAGDGPPPITPHNSWPSCASWPPIWAPTGARSKPTTPPKPSSTSPETTRSPRSWSAAARALLPRRSGRSFTPTV